MRKIETARFQKVKQRERSKSLLTRCLIPATRAMQDREKNLETTFNEGTLTMDGFLKVRDAAYREQLPEDARKFYHDLTNRLMMLYEDRRSVLANLIDIEIQKQETQEHFNSDLREVNAFHLGFRELDLFKRWQDGVLQVEDFPQTNHMQEIYDTAGVTKDSLKFFYSWLRNQLALKI